LAASLLVAVLTSPVGAEEKATAPLERKVLDRQIDEMLKVIINTGAEIHNGSPKQGFPPNTAGCYRLYHGFLIALRPLLPHHPDLQKAIDTSLAEADRMPGRNSREYSERAFTLRKTIDAIQVKVAPQAAPGRLWARLGGEANVKRVVDDFVALAAKDPKVNFFRDGAYKDKVDVPLLKKHLMELISAFSGGPYGYTGRPMKELHKGMAITASEFDALADDLAQALAKNGANGADIDAVLTAVGTTRKDIVEAKEPVKGSTLWEQLGGEATARQVVADWVALAGPDPKVNFSRGGKVKLSDAQVNQLKDGLVAFLSQATHGPIKYQGKSMKELHRGMGITNAEFDAALFDLRKALEGRGVKPLVVQDVLKLVEETRGDIVEVKVKPDENQFEDKKPGEKKSDGK
jgi:hemoglobin